ncbi:MAG: cell wall hydrolase [Rhodothermales bacterium]
MRREHLPGYILVAVLFTTAGFTAMQGQVHGDEIASRMLPTPQDPTISAEEVEASRSQYAYLVQTLRANPHKLQLLPPSTINSETLWLARAIYSETKRAEEMELVAWVVRNRVETGYRGRSTYREVVLDPFQFSAFNPTNTKRWYYANLDVQTNSQAWQRALTIAHRVRSAQPEYRPFSIRTRHFYSERSMLGRPHPNWANGKRPVVPQRPVSIEEDRFRFYEGIS